jgi:hypothetical protein
MASREPVEAPEGTAARPMVPTFQQHVALDGGVAAAVEDLAADDVDDGTHSFPLVFRFGFATQTGAATPSTSTLLKYSTAPLRLARTAAYCSLP